MSPPPGMPMRGKAPQKAKNAKKAWGDLLRVCKPYYFAIIVALVFAVGAAVIRLIGPDRVGKLSGYVLGPITPPDYNPISMFMNDILKIGILLVSLYITMFIISFLQQFIMASVTQRIAKKLRKDISKKINNLPLSYFDQTSVGDVLSRVANDVDTLSTTLNQSICSLVNAVILLVGAVGVMFYYHWIMALTAIGASLLGFMMMAMVIKRSQKHFIAQQAQLGKINGHIEEYYSGSVVVNVSNAKNQTNKQFGEMNNKLYESAWKSQFFSGLMQPLMHFVSNLGYVAVCIVGGVLVFNGSIPPSVLVSFLIYVRIFNEPLGTIAQAATNLQSTAAASERVFEFLGQPEMENELQLTGSVAKVNGAVKFNNVKFGYAPDKQIIKGFSADIPAGSKVAIVGPTGAGKTTIVNLLMKFYKTDSGDILVDGVPINELRRGNVRDLFSMVLQDTWLFEGTVRENLVYNMTDITDEQIQIACETAGIDHFIRTLPKGYDTIMNEQASISNGQKQLLTIARAMLKNAPLLILDEATSSVDTRTEELIAEAMDKLAYGRTSFVIAHRLSTIKNADMILVLKDGDIIESGTHKDLIAKKGFYADLYNSQFTLAAQ